MQKGEWNRGQRVTQHLRPFNPSANVRGMRWITSAVLLLAFALSARAAEVSLVRVWPRWVAEESFDRIGEYFGHSENERREVVVRTQPQERAGMYFLVRVKSDTALPNARFVLEVIRPDAAEPKQFTFPVSLPEKSRATELGLTGQDWPGGSKTHPVAWKLTLVDAHGTTLATEKSFLWEKPRQ